MLTVILKKYNESFIKIKTIYEVACIIQNYFSYKPDNYQFTPSYKQGKWDGYISLFDMSTSLFPLGLLSKLVYFLKKQNYEVEFVDFTKSETNYSLEEISSSIKDLNFNTARDYQLNGIQIGLRERHCILLSPTATGKSFVIYNLIRLLNEKQYTKQLIIVPTIHLVSQLKHDFNDYSPDTYGENCHMIFGGADKNTDKNIIISTWQSLQDMKPKFFKQFKTVIVDECHTGSTDGKVIRRIVEYCNRATYKIGLSGTLQNDKMHQLCVVGLYGQIYELTNVKREVERKNLSEFKLTAIKLKYNDSIRDRFIEDYTVYKKSLEKQKRANPDMKVGARTFRFEIDFINSQIIRYELIHKISEKANGNTLILFKLTSFGKKLETYLRNHSKKKITFLNGSNPIEERKRAVELMEESSDHIVIANYGIFSTGINIKRLHNIILAESIKSKVTLFQSLGRGLRMHETKEIMNMYEIVDDLSTDTFTNYGIKHFEERKKLYKAQKYKIKVFTYKG